MIIDTHCHIDLYKNPIEVLDDCEDKGVIVISMTNVPSYFELGLKYFKNKGKVRQALGFHPLFISNEDNTNELLKFQFLINQTSYIGEIGLDFSKEGIQTKNKQIQVFQDVLSIIRDCKKQKLLSLHSRGAEQEVLNNLLIYKIKFAIFHWYSGKIELIKSIVDAGYYFSINTAMIKSKRGNEIINRIPLNRVLVESDGPFIDLNGKPILPYQLNDVYAFLANKYSLPMVEIEKIVKNNFYGIINSL